MFYRRYLIFAHKKKATRRSPVIIRLINNKQDNPKHTLNHVDLFLAMNHFFTWVEEVPILIIARF